MRQALQIECFSCNRVFTMSAELSTGGGPLVEKILPCPFCDTPNLVKINADQVPTVTLHRCGGDNALSDLSEPDALLDQVFPGVKPPETQD